MDRHDRNSENLRGAGDWTYDGQEQSFSPQRNPYNVNMAMNLPVGAFGNYNQQYNRPTAAINSYAAPSYQNNNVTSYYALQPAVPTGQPPSYADVARMQTLSRVDSRQRQYQYDTIPSSSRAIDRGAYQHRPQGQPQAQQPPATIMNQSTSLQSAPRTPSYAEIVAANQPSIVSANITPRARPARSIRSTATQPPHPTQNPHMSYYTSPAPMPPEAEAQRTTNIVDPDYDLTLLDMDFMDWLDEPRVVEELSGHLAHSSTAPMRTQYTRPRAGSATASSTQSSGRRSLREIMSGTGQYRCQLCGAGFYTNEDQRKHELRVHRDVADRPYACHCGKRFDYPKDLNRHLATHEPRTPTVWCPISRCEYATKGFRRKDHLDRHMSTHYKADSAIQMSRSASSYSEQ